jgi:hypothetical protein
MSSHLDKLVNLNLASGSTWQPSFTRNCILKIKPDGMKVLKAEKRRKTSYGDWRDSEDCEAGRIRKQGKRTQHLYSTTCHMD